MIRLKPDPENRYVCPQCQALQPHIQEFVLDSVNVFAKCVCRACEFKFDQVVPVGHAVDYVLAYGCENKLEYKSEDCPEWLSSLIFKAHTQIKTDAIPIERIIYKRYKQVVILNTLDSLYGHVLLKLYNAFQYLDTETNIGLVVIVPKFFKWLVPKDCAEVWLVDLKLRDMVYGYSSLQRFFINQLERFESVYLSEAFSHTALSTLNTKQLTGVEPFKLESFSEQNPTITFILREDRWWFANPMDYWFYRICRKFNWLRWGTRLLVARQNDLVQKTIRIIRKHLPTADFNLIGLGSKQPLRAGITDLRASTLNVKVESEWCKVYAMSHVVIGIHGSNMLLPTALAAGCVEILPEDRYGNMIQDISVRYSDRQQLFFYRFADQYSSPQSVGKKAIAIIKDYPLFKRNMIVNTYRSAS